MKLPFSLDLVLILTDYINHSLDVRYCLVFACEPSIREVAEQMKKRRRNMGLIQPLISTWEKCISSIPFITELYSRPYKSIVEKEVNLAGIEASDKVLVIGCGAVPFTAIYLHLFTEAKVWAQDCDLKALKGARACLKKTGLNHMIKVFKGNAAETLPQRFDVAVVALQAEPKEKILQNLLQAVSPGGRLVFRQPSQKFSNQYDSLPQHIDTAGEVWYDMQTFDRSVLLVKPPADKGGKQL